MPITLRLVLRWSDEVEKFPLSFSGTQSSEGARKRGLDTNEGLLDNESNNSNPVGMKQ